MSRYSPNGINKSMQSLIFIYKVLLFFHFLGHLMDQKETIESPNFSKKPVAPLLFLTESFF